MYTRNIYNFFITFYPNKIKSKNYNQILLTNKIYKFKIDMSNIIDINRCIGGILWI